MKLKNCAISIAILLGGCALALKAYEKYAKKTKTKVNQPNNKSNNTPDSDVAVINVGSAYDSGSISQSLSTLDSFAESAEQANIRSPSYSESASAIQKDIDSKNADLDSLNHWSKEKPSSNNESNLFSSASNSDGSYSASFKVSRVNGSLSIEDKPKDSTFINSAIPSKKVLQEYQHILRFINKYELSQINLSYIKYAFNISQSDANFIMDDMRHKKVLEPRHDSLLDTIYKIHKENIPTALHSINGQLKNK